MSWSSLINRAEKLIGGPSPFINLGSILTAEAGFLAARARRLAANVEHPFFGALRSCLQGKSVNHSFLPMPTKLVPSSCSATGHRVSGGLIILLIGQCYAGSAATSSKLCSQHRTLAEIFETAHLAFTVHKSISNPKVPIGDSRAAYDDIYATSKDLEAVNKVATLAGDILLASVSSALAGFHNAQIVDIVSKSIEEMCEAEFSPLALHFLHGQSSLNSSRPEGTIGPNASPHLWREYVGLSRGAIMGACCQSTIILTDSGSPSLTLRRIKVPSSEITPISTLAYRLGHQWALVIRLLEERDFARRFLEERDIHTASCSTPEYIVNGLPEPTLMDASFMHQPSTQCSRPCSCHSSVYAMEYDRLGQALAGELLTNFVRFRDSLAENVFDDRLRAIAITTLGEMVQLLATEVRMPTICEP